MSITICSLFWKEKAFGEKMESIGEASRSLGAQSVKTRKNRVSIAVLLLQSDFLNSNHNFPTSLNWPIWLEKVFSLSSVFAALRKSEKVMQSFKWILNCQWIWKRVGSLTWAKSFSFKECQILMSQKKRQVFRKVSLMSRKDKMNVINNIRKRDLNCSSESWIRFGKVMKIFNYVWENLKDFYISTEN